MNKENKPTCCQNKPKEAKGFWSGLLYGLLPHTGCITFIIFSILGITAATTLIKPLLMNAYFFYALILLSFVLATISSAVYLRRDGMLSTEGIKSKWRYLSVLYGTTIGINLLLFLVVFPIAANFANAAPAGSISSSSSETLTLKVDIPCPGHSPLISGELKTIAGVQSVQFRFPNLFDVTYDPSKTSQLQILNLEVFKEYPATVVNAPSPATVQSPSQLSASDSTRSTCSNGGSCGSCGTGGCAAKTASAGTASGGCGCGGKR